MRGPLALKVDRSFFGGQISKTSQGRVLLQGRVTGTCRNRGLSALPRLFPLLHSSLESFLPFSLNLLPTQQVGMKVLPHVVLGIHTPHFLAMKSNLPKISRLIPYENIHLIN